METAGRTFPAKKGQKRIDKIEAQKEMSKS